MAITYKVVKVKNPKGADGVDFYAGRAVKTSDYSFDELMEDIESSTTVTEADAQMLKAIRSEYKLQRISSEVMP